MIQARLMILYGLKLKWHFLITSFNVNKASVLFVEHMIIIIVSNRLKKRISIKITIIPFCVPVYEKLKLFKKQMLLIYFILGELCYDLRKLICQELYLLKDTSDCKIL